MSKAERPEAPALSRRAAWALALTATFTMAVSYMDRQTFAVLSPTVTKALGLSETAYGWLVSAFSIAYLVCPPVAGRIIDRVGARRGLLGAVLLWSAVAALHALVPTFGVLFVLRIALGVAESPSFPGSAQTVHRALPPAERARGFGFLFTGSSIGAVIAPILAPFLAHHWGWRAAFLGTAAVGLCWVPVWLTLAYGRTARQVLDKGTTADPESAAMVPAAVAATPGWRVALELLGHTAVLRGVVVILVTAPFMNFVLNWGAKYLAHDYGLTQTELGKLLVIPPILFDVGAVGFGHLASVRAGKLGYDGSPPRGLFTLCAVLAVGACAAAPWTGSPAVSMVLFGIAMAGGGGLTTLFTADMLGRVSPKVISTVSGITAAAQSLAYIAVNPLVGRLLDYQVTYTAVVVGLAAWIIPGCLIWLFWRPPPLADPVAVASVTAGPGDVPGS